ncbi:MAG TPA: HypC/HybG/HupF family hydrogenase formation chaperone [Clostridiales bacterium]|nr:MAG: hydrogenase assembly protein HupF [Clostridiales bacterium GWD2_32_59]HAN09659.1 HypC/HybG/HupF family hydrogenase formation chaperone [Clostridiales bacterium]
MCIAVPAKVLEIDKNNAVVCFEGVSTKANIDLVEGIRVGDYILLHAGCAIQKINEVEAKKTLELFKQMLD